MANSEEFVYLTNLGYTGSLADKRVAYYNDLIAGKAVGRDGSVVPPYAGEFIPDIESWSSSSSALQQPASGVLSLSYFTAIRTEAINNITTYTGNTAAAATPTLIRYGVYDVAANDDLTLIASTPNDTTMLSATFTAYSKALSSTWNKVVRKRYAIGVLVVSAAAMPLFVGSNIAGTNVAAVAALAGVAPRRVGRVTAQADLPAFIAAASVTDATYRIGARLT